MSANETSIAAVQDRSPNTTNNDELNWDALKMAGEAAKEAFKAQRLLQIAMEELAAQVRKNKIKLSKHKQKEEENRHENTQEIDTSDASSETDISFHIDLTSNDGDKALKKCLDRKSISRRRHHHHHHRDRSRSRERSRGRSRGHSRGHSRGNSRGHSRGNSRERTTVPDKHHKRARSRSLSKDSRGRIHYRSHLSRDRSRSTSKGRLNICGDSMPCCIKSRPFVCHEKRAHSVAM